MIDDSDEWGTAPGAAAQNAIPVRHVAAVVVGNALEFYDFLTYSYFALQIGRTFFPAMGDNDAFTNA